MRVEVWGRGHTGAKVNDNPIVTVLCPINKSDDCIRIDMVCKKPTLHSLHSKAKTRSKE